MVAARGALLLALEVRLLVFMLVVQDSKEATGETPSLAKGFEELSQRNSSTIQRYL